MQGALPHRGWNGLADMQKGMPHRGQIGVWGTHGVVGVLWGTTPNISLKPTCSHLLLLTAYPIGGFAREEGVSTRAPCIPTATLPQRPSVLVGRKFRVRKRRDDLPVAPMVGV